MDVTPIGLGNESSGYAEQITKAIARTSKAIEALRELPLDGTAMGTGLNCHPELSQLVIELIAEKPDSFSPN